MKFSVDKIFNIKNLIKELSTGLRRLDFTNNFQTFTVTETISANTEVKIRNQLSSIPVDMLITKQTGNALVTAGDTAWTEDYIYIKNHDSTNSATVRIIFFK